MLRASYHFVTGDYSNAINCAQLAETYASALANTDLALYTQVVWCTALFRLGRLDEAMHRAQRTLERDRAAGNRREEGRVLAAMGWIALEQKEPTTAHHYLLEALKIAKELKDSGLEARALNNLAMAESSVNGDHARARQYYEQSYKLTREIGDRHSESVALGNLGFVAGVQGDFLAARSYHEQALLIAREVGNRNQEMYTLI